jgi:hypothetical protein
LRLRITCDNLLPRGIEFRAGECYRACSRSGGCCGGRFRQSKGHCVVWCESHAAHGNHGRRFRTCRAIRFLLVIPILRNAATPAL